MGRNSLRAPSFSNGLDFALFKNTKVTEKITVQLQFNVVNLFNSQFKGTQDVVIDDGLQDNIVLSTAFHHFPSEWEWFCANKNLLFSEEKTHLLLSIHMPGSIAFCMHLAGEKIKTMNWEQQKIMHYLLFKHKYVLYQGSGEQDIEENNFLLKFYLEIKERLPHLSTENIKSFVIDNSIHLSSVKKQLLKKIDFSTSYQLRYNLLSLPAETKATIFDIITAN